MSEYKYIVIDNEAGFEHLSRRTMRRGDALIVISDPTVVGLRAAVRIHKLSRELEIKINRSMLLVNRINKN